MTLIALGEVALLAHNHLGRLSPQERRRLMELMRIAKGRPSHLRPAEREELSALVAKAEPRLFAAAVADKLSPFPGTGRIIRGARRR
jgi:enhancing lycopene biosynthesis protein 2